MTMRIALVVMCTGALLQLSAAQWVALTPATTPPARTVACFAQIKGGTLMFSGAEGGHVASADTWLWRDNNWHDVSALGGGKAPPARSLGAMAAYKEGVVLFGGYTTTDHSANDTWTWDPTSGWSELSLSVAPAGRSYHSMAATEAEDGSPAVLLFGGTARTDEAHDTALGDSWVFADGEWTNLKLEPPAAPRPRWGHSLACTPPSWLEPNAGPPSCTLFGGADLSEDDHFSETWVWTRQAAKPPRPKPQPGGSKYSCYQGKCYPMKGNMSQAECAAKCTGGGAPPPDSLRAGSSFQWKQSQPATAHPGLQPVGRWSFQLASCGRGTLMTTGSIGYRICTDDTWVFNATVTKSIWTSPTVNHDAVGVWEQQLPSTHPGFLGGANLARVDDAGLGKGVLMFGGVAFPPGTLKIGPVSNQTWFWPASHCP